MIELTKFTLDFLNALNDQTRLDIVNMLRNGEKTSEDIQTALNKSQSTISQQLKKLIDASIIISEKKAGKNFYSIKDGYIFKVLSSIQSYVVNQNKERLKVLTDINIYDTLK